MPLPPIFPGKISPNISNRMFRFVSPELTWCYVTQHAEVAATKGLFCASSNHTMVLEVPQLFCLLTNEIILMSVWYQFASVEFFMVILLMLT